MRIVSKEKDFYDCIQSVDNDPHPLYVRHPYYFDYEEEKLAWPFVRLDDNFQDVGCHVGNHVIGFCGKIYPVVIFSKTDPNDQLKMIRAYCYTIEDIDRFVNCHLDKKVVERYNKPEKKKNLSNLYYMDGKFKRGSFEAFFEHASIKCANPEKYFLRTLKSDEKNINSSKARQTQNHPVFIATPHGYKSGGYGHTGTIEYDGLLTKYGFQKVKDPYTAYQDIRMYLDSIAWPEKPIPQMDDVTLAACKGFDAPWSFRRQPTKKRK